MRHKKSGRKFGRESHQRKALLRSLCTSLVKYEKIETTVQKAKDLRREIEKAVTIAKKMNVIKGESELLNIEDIAKAYGVFSPGAQWNGSGYTDATTGVKSTNLFLVYQDTYTMGDPGFYMGSTEVEVPEKFFTMK